MQALDKSKKTQSAATVPNIWRTILKSRMTRLVAASMIILAVVLSVSILNKSTSAAWAVEDTAEALGRYNAIHISGIFTDANGSEVGYNIWARANEDRTESDEFRLEQEDGQVKWGKGNNVYHYNSIENTLHIRRGQPYRALTPWLDKNFFRELKQFSEDWQILYGKDADTGRDRVFLTCRSTVEVKSLWLEFDRETNLLVRVKCWSNYDREGKPDLVAQKIVYYEDLPDGVFEFKVPEGVRVNDCQRNILGDDK